MRSRHVHSGHISPIKTGSAALGIAADRVSLCLLAPERERKRPHAGTKFSVIGLGGAMTWIETFRMFGMATAIAVVGS
jgi:hypothetical protein